MYTVHFLKGERRLDDSLKSIIESTTSEVYQEVHQKLALPSCEIFVLADPNRVIDGEMFREFLNDAESCYIFVNDTEAHRATQEDPSTIVQNYTEHLCAALYSTARILHTGVTDDCGLLEEVINEGLAGHFMSEVVGGTPKKYYIALSEKQIKMLWKQVLDECSKTTADTDKWFWGSEAEQIPPLAAFSIGFSAAARVLKKTGGSSVDMLRTPARFFV